MVSTLTKKTVLHSFLFLVILELHFVKKLYQYLIHNFLVRNVPIFCFAVFVSKCLMLFDKMHISQLELWNFSCESFFEFFRLSLQSIQTEVRILVTLSTIWDKTTSCFVAWTFITLTSVNTEKKFLEKYKLLNYEFVHMWHFVFLFCIFINHRQPVNGYYSGGRSLFYNPKYLECIGTLSFLRLEEALWFSVLFW